MCLLNKRDLIFEIKGNLQKGNVMFRTQNNLPEKVRQDVVDILQLRLSDGIDLMLQSKQAHWSIKGIHFYALHGLFDKIHEEIEQWCDLLAERIGQIGGVVEGSKTSVSSRSSLPLYSTATSKDEEHVKALSLSLATFGRLLYQSINKVMQLEDPVTADILTEIARGVDKNLWFVESHLIEKTEKIEKKIDSRPNIKSIAQ